MGYHGFKSRKFILACSTWTVIFCGSTALLVMGKIDSAQWVELTKWNTSANLGLFVAGDALEKFAARGQA